MTQSADEKRGYQRGYNRGHARAMHFFTRVCEIARRYQTRLTDIDRSRTCQNCDRWTRGAGSPNSEACMWGSCRADFEWSVEARMWVDLPPGSPRDLKPTITTQPNFGCVSWLPLTPDEKVDP